MNDWKALPDDQAEETIFACLAAFDQNERLQYAQIGLMGLAVERRELWRRRTDPETGYPCRSWSRWVRMCAPYAYSTVYAAAKDCKELADLKAEDVAQIPQSNFPVMILLSGSVRKRPEVLAAAKSQSSDEFRETIRTRFPNQHLASTKTLRFFVEEPGAIEAAIEEAIEHHDAMDRGHALLLICEVARAVWKMQAEVGNRVEAVSRPV